MNTDFPSAASPASFPRRILLAVTGLSPQVVTETVYALSRGDEAFIPTEIHLITTAKSAEHTQLSLLSKQPGWFHRLRQDYGLPAIRFDSGNVHILRAPGGALLDDIRSPEDNLLAADFITEKMRELTADDNAALHVSIAGGRKTMGFYLGYALSLFGRSQDRLSHVLVSEPFENNPDFFYPSLDERIIYTKEKKTIDARNARVILADIPFVSLRHGLPDELLKGRARYVDVVQGARQNLAPATLEINLAQKRVRAGKHCFTLPPAQLALLAVFARRTRHGDEPLLAPNKGAGDEALAHAYLRELKIIGGDVERAEKALIKGMDGDYFSQALSKLQRSLRQRLGADASPYLIDDGGCRPRRYRAKLDPKGVTILPSFSGTIHEKS